MTAPRAIERLPESLSNQIAAGEVVERPASVVKELVENAIDAGATRVTVEIEGGGITLVRVTDDGWGMSQPDARLCVERHATSKLRSIDDLQMLTSFGFRGEALPSIVSVSQFRLETRRRGEEAGTLLEADGTEPLRIKPCGGPTGTSVSVRELFFNVPARRKFLRASATESAHVTEVVENMALASPGVAVTLVRDGRTVREFTRVDKLSERVSDLLVGWELVELHGARGPLEVSGFLSRPEKARRGATGLRLFVNDRPVHDRQLARAAAFGYGSLLEPGSYPVGVVMLRLPPELVDVNVHPQKAEVRFADQRAVAQGLTRIVEEGLLPALGGQLGLAARSGGGHETSGYSRAGFGGAGRSAQAAESRSEVVWSGSGLLASPEPREAAAEALAQIALPSLPYPTRDDPRLAAGDQQALRSARFLAQLGGMFLLCESDTALLIVDQHAAAERVTFAKLRKAFSERTIASQRLLAPEVFDTEPKLAALVDDLEDEWSRFGLEVRRVGEASLAVLAVPQLLSQGDPQTLALALLRELSHAGERDYSAAIDLALATLACHGSLRAGQAVEKQQAEALIRELAVTDFGGYCPHGRPVVVRLSLAELQGKVGRR